MFRGRILRPLHLCSSSYTHIASHPHTLVIPAHRPPHTLSSYPRRRVSIAPQGHLKHYRTHTFSYRHSRPSTPAYTLVIPAHCVPHTLSSYPRRRVSIAPQGHIFVKFSHPTKIIFFQLFVIGVTFRTLTHTFIIPAQAGIHCPAGTAKNPYKNNFTQKNSQKNCVKTHKQRAVQQLHNIVKKSKKLST